MVEGVNSALSLYGYDAKKHEAKAFATEWARRATNVDQVKSSFAKGTGLELEVIDQGKEGRIAYAALLRAVGRPDCPKIASSASVAAWDIGGGSMQITGSGKSGAPEVLLGSDSTTSFGSAIIALKRQTEGQKGGSDTPNPVNQALFERAKAVATEKAESFLRDTFMCDGREERVLFGVGMLHFHTRRYIEMLTGVKTKSSYTKRDLERAMCALQNKSDEQITEMLQLPNVGSARNRLTNMILIWGYMEFLKKSEVIVVTVNGPLGVFYV